MVRPILQREWYLLQRFVPLLTLESDYGIKAHSVRSKYRRELGRAKDWGLNTTYEFMEELDLIFEFSVLIDANC